MVFPTDNVRQVVLGYANVSIPDRVLWFFRQESNARFGQSVFVSIPDRVLWFFRLIALCTPKVSEISVSIPDRVLWFFRLAKLLVQLV